MLAIYDEGMVSKVIRQPYKITPTTGYGFFFGMNMPKLDITFFHGRGDSFTQVLLQMLPRNGSNGLLEGVPLGYKRHLMDSLERQLQKRF
jgi:hypothetical protein